MFFHSYSPRFLTSDLIQHLQDELEQHVYCARGSRRHEVCKQPNEQHVLRMLRTRAALLSVEDSCYTRASLEVLVSSVALRLVSSHVIQDFYLELSFSSSARDGEEGKRVSLRSRRDMHLNAGSTRLTDRESRSNRSQMSGRVPVGKVPPLRLARAARRTGLDPPR
ncbi:hypothetical protein EYF80_013269 [Liparis tanakae]|uniref:Uncharacterized protein n=1 Tax=Liparis tanakae TaxID=230148 RepID=A0A4Z2IG54_9TELE|nr:hypothetical protein EYF80_013269 [Liparis tanakae]